MIVSSDPKDIIDPSARVHEWATIGTKPFNFPLDGGQPPKRKEAPVEGWILIARGVEIFAHANIDRGCTRATVIGPDTKIDHFAHIGHDARLAHDVCICAGAIVGGYAEIGPRTTLGLGAIVLPRVKIGADCYIGSGAVVHRDVPDNSIYAGVPARFLKENWAERPWARSETS